MPVSALRLRDRQTAQTNHAAFAGDAGAEPAAPVAARALRILMVNLIDWRRMGGGAQHQLGLCMAWRAAGHDVRMLSPHYGIECNLPDELADIVTHVASARRWRLPASLDTVLQLPALFRLVRQWRPDIVYSRHNALTPALVLACRTLGVKVVIEHNSWLPSQRRVDQGSAVLGWCEGIGQVLASRWADGVRTVTPGLRKRLMAGNVAADAVVAIGNGTNTAHFQPLDRDVALASFGLAPERTYVGFIGNIMPWHGLEQAIDGFAQAARFTAGVDLVIAGDGPSQAALQARIAALGLTERVHWLGRVPMSKANLAINCFDIALLPLSAKHDIGFGFSAIKLRDYAAAGRMVLTGHLPGATELVEEPWLVTHKPDDGEDLGAKLCMMLANRAHWRSAGAAARQYAVQHFDWKVIAAEIERFLRDHVVGNDAPSTGRQAMPAAPLAASHDSPAGTNALGAR
jgi:glycosyltransferase involved in cell wall biosynthesis